MYSKEELLRIIYDLFKITKTTPLMNTQISKFTKELGLSYKEIAQALFYFAKIEEGSLDLKYGLGIVPHVVDRAKAHFQNLKKQKEEQLKSIEEAKKIPDIILNVTKPQTRRLTKKTIDIESLDTDTDIDIDTNTNTNTNNNS